MRKQRSLLFLLLASIAALHSSVSVHAFTLEPLPSTTFARLQIGGSPGNDFYVQVSTNLGAWQNLWYDSFQSNSYVFVDLQTAPSATRFYRGVLTSSPIQLELTQSNMVAAVNPMALVQFGVNGLTTNTPVFVQFYTSSGIVAEVPPVQITSSNIVAAVPPLGAAGGSAFTNGLVSARIIQYIGNQAVMSKPFSTIQTQAAPVSKLAAGVLTLSFLKSSLSAATNILASLPGSGFDDTNTVARLSNLIVSLQGMVANVQQAVTNRSYTLSLGSISGQPILVTQQDLQTCDNLLVASLLAISASDQPGNGVQPLIAGGSGQYSALGPSAAAVAQDAISGNDPSADMQKFQDVQQNVTIQVPFW